MTGLKRHCEKQIKELLNKNQKNLNTIGICVKAELTFDPSILLREG
ncbi:MAG: hypothetical protein OXB86_04000 [Bdellovibrionales bacterium]|nr:hypothetical protein [Bdellovibrionales bacterium]